MAAEAVRQACVGDNHTCLEPSAGQGGIADFLPKDRTTCVEVSSLHAEILRRKGFQAFEADFLTWDNGGILYDRIVMNPPFSEGRWKEHVEHALTFLKEGGILVAVLPSSAKKDPAYQGAAWSQNMKFEGVSIEVALAKITKG